MNDAPQTWRATALDSINIAGRWLVGGLFIYMGLSKAIFHPPEHFLKAVHEYGIIASPLLLNLVAATLPWFEIFCGMLLVAGIAVRGTALVMLAMLVPFTLAVLRRALAIASAEHLPFCGVRFDCGCGAGEVLICSKLLENSVLVLFSCWLLAGRRSARCLRFRLFTPKLA